MMGELNKKQNEWDTKGLRDPVKTLEVLALAIF